MPSSDRATVMRRLARDGTMVAGLIFAAYLFVVVAPVQGTFGLDAWAYRFAHAPLYDVPPGAHGAFLYSPAFYQVTAPLRALSWTDFAWFWAAWNLASIVWLGPWAIAFPFSWVELYHGNIHLLMAVAVVLGFRHPWAWSFVLLTKATSGVGLLWFAVRAEWRSLGIALGSTALIATLSAVVDPAAWADYLAFLIRAASSPAPLDFGPPLTVRLVAAVIVVTWGARTDRPWTVGVAATLALPNLWWHGLALLTAAMAVAGRGRSRAEA